MNATLPMEAAVATTGETIWDETPEEWLGRPFEYEYCAECGGDAEDHVVCLVPGLGTYFARCRLASADIANPDDGRSAGMIDHRSEGDGRRHRRGGCENHHPDGVFR